LLVWKNRAALATLSKVDIGHGIRPLAVARPLRFSTRLSISLRRALAPWSSAQTVRTVLTLSDA
jgi:hypothetical protein